MPVHLFGRLLTPLARSSSSACRCSRTRPRPSAPPGVAQHGVALDLQLLPDEEPLLPRRRRARRDERRRSSPSASQLLSLPRLARQDGLRVRRLQLAPRRAAGGVRCASSCRELDGLERGAPRGRRPLRRARPRRARARCRRTSRATSTTSSSAARRERDRSARRSSEAGIASASYYTTPLHLQPALRFLGYEPGSLPATEQAARGELLAAALGRDPRRGAGARRSTSCAAARARRV